jgi:hypothetical protein
VKVFDKMYRESKYLSGSPRRTFGQFRLLLAKVIFLDDISRENLAGNSNLGPLRPRPVSIASTRWILSVFLVWHLTALALAAIPAPADLRVAAGARESNDDVLSLGIRPLLDAGNERVQSASAWAWRFTIPLRRLTAPYIERLGLGETWNMFGNPARGAEYLRLRYYAARDVAHEDGPLTAATELVFPIDPATEQVVLAFWHGHRDKAVSNAFGAYFIARAHRLAVGDNAFDQAEMLHQSAARNLRPVVQYFSAQYARQHLPPGARLLRTEAWYGWAPSRPRGEPSVTPLSRQAAIARAYRGQREDLPRRPAFKPIDTVEREADIQWTLVYVEVP